MKDYLPRDFSAELSRSVFCGPGCRAAALEHWKPLYCPWKESFFKNALKKDKSLQLAVGITDHNQGLKRHWSESEELGSQGWGQDCFRNLQRRFGLLTCLVSCLKCANVLSPGRPTHLPLVCLSCAPCQRVLSAHL